MSPHVNGFVNDLVAMAKAMEELPQREQELAEARAEIERMRQHTQGLELNIAGYKADIEGLNARNHKLEAERDDAELRFLECEEQLGSYTKVIRELASGLGMVDKPEPPVVIHEPFPDTIEPMPVEDQSEPLPTEAPHASTSTSTTQGSGNATEGQSASPPSAAPVSVDAVSHGPDASPSASSDAQHSPAPVVANPPDPTAPSMAGDGHSSGDAPSAKDGESASTSGDKPYTNAKWSEFFGKEGVNKNVQAYWDRDAWIEGGGTRESWNQ